MILNASVLSKEASDASHRVEIEPLAGGRFAVKLDGKPVEVDVQVLRGGNYSLIIGGRQFEVTVDETAEGLEVGLHGARHTIEISDPTKATARAGAAGGAAGGAGGAALLKTPMPGKVVKILVAEGDTVTRGQGVIVVEAMKMQNELKAPRAGKVVKLHVADGATVETGAKLISFE
jgi:biotin carboxyl carrier protein